MGVTCFLALLFAAQPPNIASAKSAPFASHSGSQTGQFAIPTLPPFASILSCLFLLYSLPQTPVLFIRPNLPYLAALHIVSPSCWREAMRASCVTLLLLALYVTLSSFSAFLAARHHARSRAPRCPLGGQQTRRTL